MHNPFRLFAKRDWTLFVLSYLVVILSNLLFGVPDLLTLLAAVLGVSSLLFAAKGNVWGQLLMIAFSLLYGVISWRFRYWGELLTYVGMTLPMAVWSAVTWLKNPSKKQGEVQIGQLTRKHLVWLVVSNGVVTAVFGWLLWRLNTPNLGFSILSVSTSFLAASLTMLRSSYFALAYAANDVVLVVLWTMAACTEPGYVPVAVNFVIFLLNDVYGFFCWKKREEVQRHSTTPWAVRKNRGSYT